MIRHLMILGLVAACNVPITHFTPTEDAGGVACVKVVTSSLSETNPYASAISVSYSMVGGAGAYTNGYGGGGGGGSTAILADGALVNYAAGGNGGTANLSGSRVLGSFSLAPGHSLTVYVGGGGGAGAGYGGGGGAGYFGGGGGNSNYVPGGGGTDTGGAAGSGATTGSSLTGGDGQFSQGGRGGTGGAGGTYSGGGGGFGGGGGDSDGSNGGQPGSTGGSDGANGGGTNGGLGANNWSSVTTLPVEAGLGGGVINHSGGNAGLAILTYSSPDGTCSL